MKISMIVAMGNSGQIGIDNKLLWHLKSDLKKFKMITMGHHMAMGRKTFDSIGRALPGRISLILSKNKKNNSENCYYFTDVKSLINFAKKRGEEELIVIGGATIYEEFINYSSKIYLTTVEFDGEADTFFPKINKEEWKVNESFSEYNESEALHWKFEVLEK